VALHLVQALEAAMACGAHVAPVIEPPPPVRLDDANQRYFLYVLLAQPVDATQALKRSAQFALGYPGRAGMAR